MKIERMRELLEGEMYSMSRWHRGFLESVLSQAEKGYNISDKQLEILKHIEENNNATALKTREDWKRTFLETEDIRQSWDIVARYYKKAGNYFSTTIDRYINDESFVPSREEYIKICENKYSQKVLSAHFSEPLYLKGEVVKFRKSVGAVREFEVENKGWFRPKGDSYAVVVEVDALPIRRAANASKVYRVLPFDSSRTYYVHESDIKRAKRGKK